MWLPPHGRTGSLHVDARFDAAQREMHARFEAMRRLIVQVSGGMIGTCVLAAAADDRYPDSEPGPPPPLPQLE